MAGSDYAKAAGWALLVLVLNMLLATVAILAVNATRAEPLAPEAVAAWTAPIGGFLIFFLVLRWVTARRLSRPPLQFALAIFGFYAVVDVAIGYAASGAATFQPLFLVSLGLALAGALLGAWSVGTRS